MTYSLAETEVPFCPFHVPCNFTEVKQQNDDQFEINEGVSVFFYCVGSSYAFYAGDSSPFADYTGIKCTRKANVPSFCLFMLVNIRENVCDQSDVGTGT